MKVNFQNKVRAYKNNVAGNYKFIPADQIDQLIEQNYFSSRKYDGQTHFLIYQNATWGILSPSGKDVSNKLPHLIEFAKNINVEKEYIFAGELYRSGESRERNGDVVNLIANPSSSDKLNFGVFDIVYKEESALNYEEVIKECSQLFDKSPSAIHFIEQNSLNLSELKEFFEKVTSLNAEGVIARTNQDIFKIKNEEMVDLVIMGYTLEHDQKSLRSISFGVMVEEKVILHIGASGNFNSAIDKDKLLSELSAEQLNCDFIQKASDGSIYKFTKPKKVVSVKFVDTQYEKSDDNFIKKTCFEIGNNELIYSGKRQSISLIGSSIESIRDDKSASIEESGLSQLIRVTSLDKDYFTNGFDLGSMNKSKIEVVKTYTKKTKDKTAIRKFLIWKTNKVETGLYPEYVLYSLDFSEGRKDPIKREVFPYSDLSRAQNHLTQLIDENIKKGWEEFLYG